MRLFAAAVALLVALNYLGIEQEYAANPGGSVVYFMQMFVFTGPFAFLAIFLGLVPYGSSFCVDWKNQFIRCHVIRTSKSVYAWSKVIAVATSAFAAVFAGYVLTILLFWSHMPMGHESYDGTVLSKLIAADPLVYLLVRAAVFGAFCMFWAVFALLVSAYCANIFVTLSAPLIAYYFVVNGPGRWLPSYLQLHHLSGGTVSVGGPWLTASYCLLVFVVMSGLAGLLFCHKVKRRLANG